MRRAFKYLLSKLLFYSVIAALEVGGGLVMLLFYVAAMPFVACHFLTNEGWPTAGSEVRFFLLSVIVPFSIWVLLIALI
jgi:hypothetical protein